jgi:hypothetical protein
MTVNQAFLNTMTNVIYTDKFDDVSCILLYLEINMASYEMGNMTSY